MNKKEIIDRILTITGIIFFISVSIFCLISSYVIAKYELL